MNKNKPTYFKNMILPCFLLSCVTGLFVGVIIFFYKLLASYIIKFSEISYLYVRENPVFLPLLVLAVIIVSAAVSLLLKYAPSCKGGGIASSISQIRGYISVKWKKLLSILPISSLLTYLVGVPLGNEGPSVQLGTASGYAVSRLLPDKKDLDKLIMTGGASVGFSAATGTVLSGIVFAFEEAHKRFSAIILLSSGVSVAFGSLVSHLLCRLFKTEPSLFGFKINETLPLHYFWIGAVIGIVIGAFSILFVKLHKLIGYINSDTLKSLPFQIKALTVFLLTAISGFAYEGFIGTGHHLIENIIHGSSVWYLVIIVFCVRMLLLMLANTSGISGGLFIPRLALGALLGALLGNMFISLAWIDEKYFAVIIIISMTSFLASEARMPITAFVFSIEALSGIYNMLPILLGVTTSYFIIKLSKTPSFSDIIIEKTQKRRKV